MAEPIEDLQKAVLQHLSADADIAALVGNRITDGRPTAYPSITFGPGQTLPDDMDCIDAAEEYLQLDVWARGEGRLRPARALTSMVVQRLHGAALALDTHALASLRVEDARTLMDPDGLTGHGVVTLVALIERR